MPEVHFPLRTLAPCPFTKPWPMGVTWGTTPKNVVWLEAVTVSGAGRTVKPPEAPLYARA